MTLLTRNGSQPQSERKLSEVARHLILPTGIVSTGWPGVEAQLKKLEIPLDQWQKGFCQSILAKREDGQYACGIGGAVASIPRQSGKTYTIGALVFALCMAIPGSLILWTAHRTRTHNETFKTMDGMANRPAIKPYVRSVRKANGEQEVEFTNGSRILFGAREAGFGRGFAKVDVVVLDEAQILTEKAMEDMVPATNAADNGLVIMVGTPPRPSDPGEVFTNRREAALSGDDEDTLYVEFSADQGANPNDRKQWTKANPSFPGRTSESAILRMRKLLGSIDSFNREGLGIWDEESLASKAVNFDKWVALGVDDPDPDWPYWSLGVDMNPEQTKISIAFAALRDDELPHVELLADTVFSEDGTSAVVEFLWERCRRRVPVVMDAFSPARDMLEVKLKQRGLKVHVLTTGDYVSACALMAEAVNKTGALSHFNQEQLDDAAAVTVREFLKSRPNSYKWNREELDDDITPFVAATCAHFGTTFARKPRRSGEAVVEGHGFF